MMDIDEELKSQINSVFDDFDDGQSEQGWASLRTKYPEEKNRKLPIWWISGIAAAFLLMCGLWLLLEQPNKKNDEKDQIVKRSKAHNPNTPADQVESKSSKNSPNNEVKIDNKENPVLFGSSPRTAAIKKQDQQPSITDQQLAPDKSAPLPAIASVDEVQKNVVDPVTKAVAAVQTKDVSQNGVTTAAVVPSDDSKSLPQAVRTKQTTEEFLIAQSKLQTSKDDNQQKKASSNKNSFEVFTGTFLNYADNDVKVNAGFGLNANIQVSRKLFLSLGAGVSQNKISNQNRLDIPPSSAMASDVMSSPSSAAYTSNSFLTDIKLAAQLLNLDIPIAIKFYPTKKQNFYVSTGINSSTYLSQNYTYSYTILSPSSFYNNYTKSAKEEERTEKSQIGGFDFANSAIFAIGINQNIGQHQLIFEPYFKPAIGNMGDKNLRINTVGLNLKFNFNTASKK